MKKVYVLTEEEIKHIKDILYDMKCDIWEINDDVKTEYVRSTMMTHCNNLEEILEDF